MEKRPIKPKMTREKNSKNSQKNIFFFFFFVSFFSKFLCFSPKFVVDGRVKYPIDDKLLQIYGSLFNDVTKSSLYVNTKIFLI